jgi:hypothetical protein
MFYIIRLLRTGMHRLFPTTIFKTKIYIPIPAPLTNSLIRSHPVSSSLIQFHPVSPCVVQTHPISSEPIQSHPTSSSLIQPHPVQSCHTHSHPVSSNLIQSHPVSSKLHPVSSSPNPFSSNLIRPYHSGPVSPGLFTYPIPYHIQTVSHFYSWCNLISFHIFQIKIYDEFKSTYNNII